mmetsp:Transcript_173/g.454  ORF Transcript_173/g.454 Transcript_173/m.454 type:complete len:227 (+) Transcript_173:756-1436(+)
MVRSAQLLHGGRRECRRRRGFRRADCAAILSPRHGDGGFEPIHCAAMGAARPRGLAASRCGADGDAKNQRAEAQRGAAGCARRESQMAQGQAGRAFAYDASGSGPLRCCCRAPRRAVGGRRRRSRGGARPPEHRPKSAHAGRVPGSSGGCKPLVRRLLRRRARGQPVHYIRYGAKMRTRCQTIQVQRGWPEDRPPLAGGAACGQSGVALQCPRCAGVSLMTRAGRK